MKKLFNLTVLLFSVFIFTMCSNEEIIQDVSKSDIIEETFVRNEYNLDLRDFALAVSNAMNNSKDFRKLIKKEALMKFDGDYDVLLSRIMNKSVKVDNSTNTLRSESSYSVEDLLNDYYVSSDTTGLRAATISTISSLSVKYPNLQVAVPVHAEKLDENTVPAVTFVPSEYEDGVTRYVTGYNPDGSTKIIDALTAPDEAVIVVSQNERMQLQLKRSLWSLLEDLLPASPTELTATQTQSGILLYWKMPSINYATGYKIYRKDPSSTNYNLLYIQNGKNNITYNDFNFNTGGTYSYYVTAYNILGESSPSNAVSAQASPRPAAPTSFDATLNTNKEVELHWTINETGYIEKVELHRYILNQTSGYQLYQTFSTQERDYFDRDIVQGKTIRYKIQNINNVGVSNPLYEIVKIPYRDPSKSSPIRIKHIKCSENVEGWLMGTPELRIKICGVDSDRKTTEIKDIYVDMDKYDQGTNIWLLDWKPDSWYQVYTFHVVEEDPGQDTEIDITAKLGVKKTIAGILDIGVETGMSKKFKFSAPENIGSTDLSYYDPVNTTLKFKNDKYWCNITLGQ